MLRHCRVITNISRTCQHWSAFICSVLKERALNCCDLNAVWLCQLFIECIFALWPQLPQSFGVFNVLLSSIQRVVLKSPWNWIDFFFMEYCTSYLSVHIIILLNSCTLKFSSKSLPFPLATTSFNSLMMCLLWKLSLTWHHTNS